MKTLHSLYLICLLFVTQISQASENTKVEIQKGEKIIFFGDSITQLGARANGYVTLVDHAIQQARPEDNIQVIGKGVGGNKVPDLLKRLKRDVLDHTPTTVMVYIGINDIWHWTKPHPVTKEPRQGTTAEAYEAGLRDIVQQLQEHEIKVILCTPTVIGENTRSKLAEAPILDQYAAIVRNIASDTDTELIDLRSIFVEYLKNNNPQNQRTHILTSDCVHMNDQGNVLIASTILKHFNVPTTALATHAPPEQELDIYLLIGQSNMAGRARITDELTGDIKDAFLLNEAAEWAPASNPLNRYSTVRKSLDMQKLGLGYSFARTMLKAQPNKQIGLVVNARGGSKIESWQKDQQHYTQALARVRIALDSGKLKGILWHQGESNWQDPDYLQKLIQVVNNFREDLEMPNLPFIVGEINGVELINQQLRELPKKLNNTACVSAKALTASDKWHFDTESQLVLGKRYANTLILLEEN